jgi:hypothetical protein
MVLIAPTELLSALAQQTSDAALEVLTFSNTDALRALQAITLRRPQVVALERLFAATPRGAALINRIKADPTLVHSEIRVIAHDSKYSRVSPRRPAPAAERPLDQRGTRRAPRYKVATGARAVIDGRQAAIVDLSVHGAQISSPAQLKPTQRVQMTLSDKQGAVSCTASVAWASFEIPPNSAPRYRAGVAFVDPETPAIDAFISRNKSS